MCLDSHGAVQSDGMILLQLLSYFSLFLGNTKRIFSLQHSHFFKVNKQVSNLFLENSCLLPSLPLHMGKGTRGGTDRMSEDHREQRRAKRETM